MKKTLFALAALSLISASAQAQSNVTIYGVVDAGVTYTSKVGPNNNSRLSVDSGDLSTSRIGFNGVDDKIDRRLQIEIVRQDRSDGEFRAGNETAKDVAQTHFLRCHGRAPWIEVLGAPLGVGADRVCGKLALERFKVDRKSVV